MSRDQENENPRDLFGEPIAPSRQETVPGRHIHPVVIARHGDHFELVDGCLRCQALRELGLDGRPPFQGANS